MTNWWGNHSLIDALDNELPDSTFYWLLISIIVSIIWIVYLTYYNSRVIGLILTLILNRFVKYGHVKFGSFSFSLLSGKIMFRDVHFITEDFCVRIQLGLAIFRWWRPLILKGITEDLSHSETRLSVYLDSFELHVYNRSKLYNQLEKYFGLDPSIIPTTEEEPKNDNSRGDQTASTRTNGNKASGESKWQWRDLIPVIKVEISSGRLVFGNYLLPTTLCMNFGDAHVVYTTKPASTPFDQFMHILKFKADNTRVMLVPSPKYQGPVDEPPRLMGEGFVVLQSHDVDIYYYFDEAGIVPNHPELLQLANGDVIARRTWPCWGMDVKCGKGTDISYGPWADRQREFLWKFFYPADYQPLEETELPESGQLRTFKSFDFKFSVQSEFTIDILFTKNKETQAIHMNCRAGSYLEFTIPMITDDAGYITKVNGQMMQMDATTSLQFRQLAECETLEFDIEIKYPKQWNEHQDWRCDLTACKATAFLIFHHKLFFMDMIDDWSSKTRPDIYHFVPYTWRFNLLMKEFEILTLCNEWNWIDCFGSTPENAHIAFCGDTFDMSFNLPFIDYLPPTVPVKFFIRGECADCRLYLPETNTSHHIILAISQNMKIMDRDGTIMDEPFCGLNGKKWRRRTQKSAGWIDCWTTPIVALSIGYTYHPIPPSGLDHKYSMTPISTPDAEEMLLIPLRFTPTPIRPLRPKKGAKAPAGSSTSEEFEPTAMEPDVITVELEVGPSVICVYGSLVRNFLHIKENYLGEDQKFTDYNELFSATDKGSTFEHIISPGDKGGFDPRHYRPLEVKVQATLHDIQAHLVKNCIPEDPPCPCVYIERLGFELDKRYLETRLQVLVSPAVLIAKDTYEERPPPHGHLKDGHMALSGLQIRGHAMFSHEGLPLDSETLEYAWLLELLIGDLTGRLTSPQLQNIVEFLQTFAFLIEDSENELQRSCPYFTCQHGVPQPDCKMEPKHPYPCPTGDDIKYRMTRCSVDCVDLYLVEAGTALNVQIYPVRVSTCNLHGKNNKAGITALVPQINFKQFVLSIPVNDKLNGQSDHWLEAGGVCLGPINIDAAMALPRPEFHSMQNHFLQLHDKKTERLLFMWPPDFSSPEPRIIDKCGCIGGCLFFGNNRNGSNFFQPSDKDYAESINACVFRMCDGKDYGYGQSLLHTGQFMFEVHPSTIPVTPSRSKQKPGPSKGGGVPADTADTPKSSTTLVGPPSARQSGYISDGSMEADDEEDDGRTTATLTRENVNKAQKLIKPSSLPLKEEQDRDTRSSGQSIGKNSTIPSEYLPDDSIPDAYDTDRYVSSPSDEGNAWGSAGSGSVSSLPDITRRKQRGHKRQHSYDTLKAAPTALERKPSNDSNQAGSVDSGSLKSPGSGFLYRDLRGSKGSIPSSSGTSEVRSVSRHSSLTSPILRRLSSQLSVHREGSISSTAGSERFFSAAEDVSGSDYDSRILHNLARQTSSGSDQANFSLSNPSFGEVSWSSHPDESISQTVLETTMLPHPAKTYSSSTVSSETESLASFISAVSSQAGNSSSRSKNVDEGDGIPPPFPPCQDDEQHLLEPDEAEDSMDFPVTANIIDLHGQINQPITRSPLLMSCYLNHMTKLKCSHWSTPPPLSHLITRQGSALHEDPSMASFSSRLSASMSGDMSHGPVWIPQFQYMRQGFSPSVMVNKREPKTPPDLSSPSSASEKSRKPVFFPDSMEDLGHMSEESVMHFEDHVSKTSATVNLKGSVDIMVSPLMLEALQRYVEAVTPVLSSMHPSAIVDSLHLHCSSATKAQNKLKKSQSDHQSADRKDEEGAETAANQFAEAVTGTDSKTSRLQVVFSLSKINICILQASLVEEMISFSALDRIHELTCVSVLAVCFDSISCRILLNNHSQKSLELVTDASPDSANKKMMPPSTESAKKQDSGQEAEEMQVVERQQEDTVGSLHISRIHFQLRRMKRDSNFSENVFLTAIPEYRSKVLFTFQKQPEFEDVEVPPPPSGLKLEGEKSKTSGETAEDIAGFIMFECGLENIDLRLAKRIGYSQPITSPEDELLSHQPKKSTSAPNQKNPNVPHDRQSLNSEASVGDSTSWQSRVSIPSDATQEPEEEEEPLEGDASSCVLEFKGVWFNFAAPPPSPKKKKLEYTRLDWNLLSTATPAINAWLNPGHRAIVAAKTLLHQLKSRISITMACIMTEALDVQGIHMPVRSKFTKITSLSKTLQEDPSCQLLTVLRRYISRVGIQVIEESVVVDTVPQLLTIQKGLLALTRQWKNVLYMPILAEGNFKSRKKVQPYTVTFAIPNKDESMDNIAEGLDDGDITLDNYDIVDEKTSLLKAEGGSTQQDGSFYSLPGSMPPSQPLLQTQLSRPASEGNVLHETAGGSEAKQTLRRGTSTDSVKLASKKSAQARSRLKDSTPYGSAESGIRHSISQRSQSFALPGISTSSGALQVPGRGIRRNESNISLQSEASSEGEPGPGPSIPSTPMRQSLTRHLSELEKREGEDLYRWMQRQQEYTRLCNHPNLHCYPSMGQESLMYAGVSEYSQDDSMSLQPFAMSHPMVQVMDAQILFKPLLRAIGLNIGAIKTSALMKKFGGNVSAKVLLQMLRVDIVDSETSTASKGYAKGKGKPRKLPKFHIDTGFETPAFLCDTFSVMLSMEDVVDFEKEKDDFEGLGSSFGSLGHEIRRKSLRTMKLTLDHLEAKSTTTKINFSINCTSVNQHVNMSMLRLAHQFVTMIENINETRHELKGITKIEVFKGHRKQDSKGSSTGTGTDTQSVNLGDLHKNDSETSQGDKPKVVGQRSEESGQSSEGVSQMSPQSPGSDSNTARPDKLLLPKSPRKLSGKKGKFEFLGSKFGTEVPESHPKVQSPPRSLNLSDSVVVEVPDTSSPALAEKTIVDEIKENTPKCWRTLYHLLDLYSTMPETKTVNTRPHQSRLSVIDEEPEKVSQTHSLPRPPSSVKVSKVDELDALERQAPTCTVLPPRAIPRTYTGNTFTQSILIGEKIPLVVFGMAKVKRIRISAMLSGLKLEADLQNVHGSATHRERVKGVIKRKTRETSVTAFAGHTMIVLLEGVPPSMQTVVTVNVAKSQGLFTAHTKRSRDHNSCLVTIGKVDVDIPQHPVVLHGMVARGSKRLSNTLQEFIRPVSKVRSFDSIDGMAPSQQPSKHSELSDVLNNATAPQPEAPKPSEEVSKPLIMHFKGVLQGLTIGASLLPSLKAQYKMGQVTSSGVTGRKARFTVDLPTHSLSFTSKLEAMTFDPITTPPSPKPSPPWGPFDPRDPVNTPTNLPSSASVDLPPIHIHADYRLHNPEAMNDDGGLTEGLSLREGNYFNAVAEVGSFEHSLTTDLLNHLVFVQKVFMKEINEVVQKVSGGDQPVPLWTEDGLAVHREIAKPILYSLHLRLKGIQITATTPTNNAVRLETGMIELELSNRVQPGKKEDPGSSKSKDRLKVFVKMQLDVNLALGMLLKNQLFEEAEPEFQHLASFATRITLRNALQDEMIPGSSKDQEALLIALKRPVIFVQPVAFDKAVLVWLNYKNAYEYWNEQRLALNKEVQTATQQVIEKLPLGHYQHPHPQHPQQHSQQQQQQQTTSQPALSTLFLQLTVDDLGICLPLGAIGQVGVSKLPEEPRPALVLTLEYSELSACSRGSLVSKGTFNGFCLRFADDFEVSWDDWKPDGSLEDDIVMNAMVVPKGTYEVCSQTRNAPANEPFANPKWVLNVKWRMKGIDIHLDTNIGKQLADLGNALTSLAGDDSAGLYEEGVAESEREVPDITIEAPSRRSVILEDELPDFVFDPSLDSRTRARLIEQEMNEQAKVVDTLQQLGASQLTIETEQRKLQELQAAVFQDFRQDIINKLKRQSVRASGLKDKLGLGYKPTHNRSRSTSVTSTVGRRSNPGRKAPGAGRKLASYNEAVSPLEDDDETPTHARTLSLDVADLDLLKNPKVTFDSSPLSAHPDLMSTTLDDPSEFRYEDVSPSTPASPPYRRLAMQDILDSTSDDEDDPELVSFGKPSQRHDHDEPKSAEGAQGQKVPSPSVGSTGSANTNFAQDPSVDFEMDIQVNVDRGKCVLHPKEPKQEPDTEARRRLSPRSERKKASLSAKKTNLDATLNRMHQLPPIDNITLFYLPAVDIKIHYNSKTSPSGPSESPSSTNLSKMDVTETTAPSGGSTSDSVDSSVLLPPGGVSAASKKCAVKKASLYAWLSLEQLPEEMLISPTLLDFLEQALEPIPMAEQSQPKTPIRASPLYRGPVATPMNRDASTASIVSSGTVAYTSFPVDVVVYICVQPSIIRFTCLPVSRVECLFRLPSFDVVFSTKRGDIDSYGLPEGLPFSAGKATHILGKRLSSSSRTRTASGHQMDQSSGGLSVMAILTDFSLYIFHPYGGGQKKTSLSSLESAFRKSHQASLESGTSPLLDTTSRKDSFSLNVEFVKVNISRSRKGVLQGDIKATPGVDLQHKAANVVRFSAVCDVGSASFKYDMRRLSEILALPKAWYRRSLARRMFLGEETALLDSDSEGEGLGVSDSPPTPDSPVFSPYGKAQTFSSLQTPKEKLTNHRRVASEDRKNNSPLSGDLKRELDELKLKRPVAVRAGSAPQSPLEDRLRFNRPTSTLTPPLGRINVHSPILRSNYASRESDKLHGQLGGTPITPSSKSVSDWETLVIFAVNLSRLDVMVNMSNVMGNTVWSTTDIESQGRLSIDSRGYKNMKITAGLGGSKLEARSGIVGGNIELQRLNVSFLVNEDPGKEPDHKAGLSLDIMESRLDYMGSSVLMKRVSDFTVKLGDEWRLSQCSGHDAGQPLATKRNALIFVHGDLSWDKFHLMISRSTTPDLIKMVNKLEEFFTQQLNSSKRVLSAFGPIPGSNKLKHRRKNSETASWISEIRHHRHWQNVLENAMGCKLSMLNFTLPEQGTILGGTMSMRGNGLSLACFHGINFRSKSWALFTMDEPYISFATESQDVLDNEAARCTHIVENLSFQLGHNMTQMKEKRPMAMVCKLSRGHYMPPPFTSVQEWFHYAFATTEIKDLDSFPQMARQGSESPTERRASSRRGQEYSHDTEVIFVLPSLQMHLKTEHMQGEEEPAEGDDKPVVECSFVTEFEDHIFVAMDAEVIFFLHDLVTNYVREKDKGSAKVPRSPEAERKMPSDTTALLKQDYREFVCNTWHLEPTVRLQTWAGKRIEPVGIDFILQKLGFQHARLTIPKWMQRGCMDPLDKILSLLVDRMITTLRESVDKEEEEGDKTF